MNSDFIGVLKNKNFLKLWLSQIFSQTANNLLNFLLLVRVYDMTGSSLKVGFLVLCFTLPSILFSVFAGIFADHFSQKKIMYVVNLFRAVLTLGFIVLDFNIYTIYILTFAISSLMQFFSPAEAARIPAVIDRKYYLAANSIYVSTNYMVMVIGFSMVSFIQFLRGENQFILISLSFFLSSLVILFLPKDHVDRNSERVILKTISGFKTYFRDGFNLIKSNPGIYLPIIHLVFVWASFGIAYVIISPLAKEVLNIPTTDAGKLIVLPAVLGTVLGGIIVERVSKKINKIKIIITGIFIIGLVAMFISLIPEMKSAILSHCPENILYLKLLIKNYSIVSLLMMVGIGAMFIIAPAQTMLQENTESESMGTVFGFLNMSTNTLNMLPILIIGYIADEIKIQNILLIVSMFVLIFGIINVIYYTSRSKRLYKKDC